MLGKTLRIISILLITYATSVFAQEIDIQYANKYILEVWEQIDTEDMQAPELSFVLRTLEDMQDSARDCISDANQKLDAIKEIEKTSFSEAKIDIQAEDRKYIARKKQLHDTRLSECRLFIFRTNDLIVDIKRELDKASKSTIFRAKKPVWETVSNLNQPEVYKKGLKRLINRSGIVKLELGDYMVLLLSAFVFGVFGLYVQRLCKVQKRFLLGGEIGPLWASLVTGRRFAVPLFVSLGITIASRVTSSSSETILSALSLFFTEYVLFIMVAYFYRRVSLNEMKRAVWRRAYVGATFFLGIASVYHIIITQGVMPQLVELLNFATITTVAVVTLWSLWIVPNFFFYSQLSYRFHKELTVIFKTILLLVTIAVISLEFIGYRQLSLYTVQSTVYTLGIIIGVNILFNIGNRITTIIHNNLNKTAPIHGVEFTLLKILMYSIVISWAFLVILQMWGIPIVTVDAIQEALVTGFSIYNIEIIPLRFAIALIVFSMIQIIGKYISVLVARKRVINGEDDTQVAISSIIIYIVFAIALVSALFISGVDFTGLAIVAGALSVGIGLGLQNIVNNFVSGLILLIEKPIKPGDRILVGTTEGYVKKISIRSTRILTLLSEDMIIPNSELIANPVINYVFNDCYGKIMCAVGVAYGSDVSLVQKTLLEVAEAHPEVLNTQYTKPMVAFREFGDSSLNFEVWCTIKNINNKFMVRSELNTAIDQAFREKGIVIAFPQLDVHIIPQPT